MPGIFLVLAVECLRLLHKAGLERMLEVQLIVGCNAPAKELRMPWGTYYCSLEEALLQAHVSSYI